MWKLCPRSFVLFVIDVILDATSLVTWQTPVIGLAMQSCASDAPSEVNILCTRIGVGATSTLGSYARHAEMLIDQSRIPAAHATINAEHDINNMYGYVTHNGNLRLSNSRSSSGGLGRPGGSTNLPL